MPFTIKSAERLCLISSGGETKLYRAGVLGGGGVKGRWWRRRREAEAPRQLLLFVYATQQHTSGGVPLRRLAGPPDSPRLIFEGWGCLNNSSQSSQCPVRHHLSPQECG